MEELLRERATARYRCGGLRRRGFTEAVAALTAYRRLLLPHPEQAVLLIFNDYMNCLWADPTEENELPMIEAAAKAGCDYYVIDAGWYAALHEDWSQTSERGRHPRPDAAWPRYVLTESNSSE